MRDVEAKEGIKEVINNGFEKRRTEQVQDLEWLSSHRVGGLI
jgi:hypothetical protein